jgi:Uma2 family endonuclease
MTPPSETVAAPRGWVPISEIPGIVEHVYRMPLADYQRAAELGTLPENVELLRGIVVAKMSKSPLHESIVSRLTRLLNQQLPEHLLIRSGAPLTLLDSEPEPDLAVVDARPDDWSDEHPRTAYLVIEVAIHSLRTDLEKALIYAEAGLPEYWLVKPEEKSIMVHREPAPAGYRSVKTFSGGTRIRAGTIDFWVSASEIFRR